MIKKIILFCLITMLPLTAIAENSIFKSKTNDVNLQKGLDRAIHNLKLNHAVKNSQLSLVLMDITDSDNPKLASANGSKMFYAASLPKIVILLGAFHKAESGKLNMTPQVIDKLTKMIRFSSNSAATEMMNLVGMKYIAEMLQSDEFRLYDKKQGGGLWLGKEYGKKGYWKRDPMHNISHGATSLQVAKFYYLLANHELLTPESCRSMLEIMGESGITHKFVKGIKNIDSTARIFRKSGSWRDYHSDSALIERNGHSYIAVALAKNKNAGKWLQDIIVEMDALIVN